MEQLSGIRSKGFEAITRWRKENPTEIDTRKQLPYLSSESESDTEETIFASMKSGVNLLLSEKNKIAIRTEEKQKVEKKRKKKKQKQFV